MDYFELIEKRHSVRSYKSDMVEKNKLDKVLEAARLAPTAANRQAFRVFVLGTKGHEAELKSIYGRDWLIEAPYVLCVCTIPDKCWIRGDRKNYSDVDAAIVMDHMILAATAQGLGTCWIGAFNAEVARKVLEIDDTYEPVLLTPLGYPKDTAYKKVRKSIDEIVVYK